MVAPFRYHTDTVRMLSWFADADPRAPDDKRLRTRDFDVRDLHIDPAMKTQIFR